MYLLVRTNNNVRSVKDLIIGTSTQRILAEETQDSTNITGVPDETIIALKTYLTRTGFGFGLTNLTKDNMINIVQSPSRLEENDREGIITLAERIYMLYNDKTEKDRPEYDVEVTNPGPEPKIEIKMDEYAFFVAYYTIFGETKESRPEATETLAIEAIQDEFNDDLEAWKIVKEQYDKGVKWVEWRDARNEWMIGNKEYFQTQSSSDSEYNTYTQFWAQIARVALGLIDNVNEDYMEPDELVELVDMLYAQIWDENGDPREEINILEVYLTTGKYDPYEPTDVVNPGPDNPGTDPDNPGTDPDNPGTDPDNPGTDPDNPGADPDNPGTDPDDPGTVVPPDEVEDPIPAEVQSIEITSPTSGTYRAGQEVKFTVTFDKNIYGTTEQNKVNAETAPVLLIHFNDPNLVQVPEAEDINKQATFESASGKTLTYTYIIEEGDNGRLGLAEGDNFKGTVYNIGDTKTELTKIEKLDGENEIIADTIGPELPTIEVTSEAKSYKIGEEIEIKVTFGEKVYGNDRKVGLIEETVPVLNIKFGEGEIKNPKIKTIGEQELVYSYIIEQEDRGTLTIEAENAFDGTKAIYDEVGNKTEIKQAGQITGNTITANDDLTIIKLDKAEITLDLNGTKEETITATVEPAERKITWSTSDDKVATVDENGKITAVAIGETIITAKAEDGATAECKVTVKDTTNGETKVTLNKENITLDLGGTKEEQLSATVEPTELEVTWTSSDENVAKVDETGEVTAIKVGTAEITAKAKDGTIAKCQVTVTDENETVIEPEEIKVNITNPTVAIDRTTEIQLKPELVPSNSNTSTKLTYKSSNEEVATVDENGKVTIKAPGTTIITVITENGKLVSNNLTVVETEDLGENLMLGDVSQDGKVDSTDLLMILRYKAADSSDLTRTKHQDWRLEEAIYVLGDIDADGTVDTTDILKIQRYIAYLKSDSVKQDHPDWEIKNDWE